MKTRNQFFAMALIVCKAEPETEPPPETPIQKTATLTLGQALFGKSPDFCVCGNTGFFINADGQ